MKTPRHFTLRHAFSACLFITLAACGGGSSNDAAVLQGTQSSTQARMQALATGASATESASNTRAGPARLNTQPPEISGLAAV